MTETPRQEAASSLKIYFRLLAYVKPYIGYFLVSIIGYVIFASTQPMLAGILKYFVDGLSNPDAALFPGVPWLAELPLLHAVPLPGRVSARFSAIITWLASRLVWCTTCVCNCSTACSRCPIATTISTIPAT